MNRYKIDQPLLFENMRFNCDVSTRIAIVGSNGSGKSTLLRYIYIYICNFVSLFMDMHKDIHIYVYVRTYLYLYTRTRIDMASSNVSLRSFLLGRILLYANFYTFLNS